MPNIPHWREEQELRQPVLADCCPGVVDALTGREKLNDPASYFPHIPSFLGSFLSISTQAMWEAIGNIEVTEYCSMLDFP